MIVSFIHRAIMQGIPLLFGSTGEIITEKSGNLNLGIPGIMYVGAISGVIGAFLYEQSLDSPQSANAFLAIVIPLLSCLAGSLIMGLIYSFLTTTLRANQNVTGLALTTFGVGFGNFFGGSLIKLTDSDVPSITLSTTSKFFSKSLPIDGIVSSLCEKIPFIEEQAWIKNGLLDFGEIFLSYSFLAYTAIIIALVCAFMLKRTKVGLQLRAVGENPATADAAGINVNKYKYVATCAGGMIAGLGGLYYVMDYANGIWSNDAFGDRGWLAIALVIFAVWKPNLSIVGSILFGGLFIVHNYIPNLSVNTQEIFKMLPYVVTIIVLVAVSMRKKRENQNPASLGLSYFREER